jgi:hypothetical protein
MTLVPVSVNSSRYTFCINELMAEVCALPSRMTRKSPVKPRLELPAVQGVAVGVGEGEAATLALSARGTAEMPRRIACDFVCRPGSTCAPNPVLGWYSAPLHGQPAAVKVTQGSAME